MGESADVREDKQAQEEPSGNDVGYCRPPKAHQFKLGQSGNPKGRPKGAPTLQEVMAREATKLIKVKQGDNVVSVPKLEALARRVFTKALEGDLAAARMIFQLAAGPEMSAAESVESFALPGDDVIKRMLRRFDHMNPQSESK